MAQRGGEDSGMEMWAVILVVLAVLIYLGLTHLYWIYATAWKYVRIAEVGLLAYIIPDFIQAYMPASFNAGLHFLLTSNPQDLDSDIVGKFDNMYVKYFNWLPAILLVLAGCKLFINAEDIGTIHNMESMLIKMSKAFPHNKQFLSLHPEKLPLDFYPDDPNSYEYTLAMTERQFATVVPPLGLAEQAKKHPALRKPIWDGKKGFSEDLARKAFESQIGPLYRGLKFMSDDERRLYDQFKNQLLVKRNEMLPVLRYYVDQAYAPRLKSGVFKGVTSAAKRKAIKLKDVEFKYKFDFASHKALAQRMQKFVDEGLREKGEEWMPKDVDIRMMLSSSEYKPLLRQVMADERMSRHAFTYTGLMTLLEDAREGATLAPSSLRWLKGRNRPLWFALNCVGKKVAYTESSGTFAHWLLEKEAKMAVPYPEVTEAIEGLRVALGLASKYSALEEDWS